MFDCCSVQCIAVQTDSSMLEANDLPCFRQWSQIDRQICLSVHALAAHPPSRAIHSKRGQSASNKRIAEHGAVARMPKVREVKHVLFVSNLQLEQTLNHGNRSETVSINTLNHVVRSSSPKAKPGPLRSFRTTIRLVFPSRGICSHEQTAKVVSNVTNIECLNLEQRGCPGTYGV